MFALSLNALFTAFRAFRLYGLFLALAARNGTALRKTRVCPCTYGRTNALGLWAFLCLIAAVGARVVLAIFSDGLSGGTRQAFGDQRFATYALIGIFTNTSTVRAASTRIAVIVGIIHALQLFRATLTRKSSAAYWPIIGGQAAGLISVTTGRTNTVFAV